MKSLISFTAFGLLAAGTVALAGEAGTLDPAGTWLTEDGQAKIKIEKCGTDNAHICGNVVWLKEPLDGKGHPKTDLKNPDPAKRSRTTIGMPLFTELTPDEDKVYAGEIYNAENGKSYDVTFRVEKPADLHVKGCMLSVLCGSQHWAKVADLPLGTVAATQPKKIKLTPAE